MTMASQIDDTHEKRRSYILRTVLTGIVAKSAFFLSALLIARIAIPHLGTERFGVLMTVLSLMAFLTIADLGVGSSLVTSLSRALGAGEYQRVRQLQINGLAAVSSMAIAVCTGSISLLYIDIGTLVFPASGRIIQMEATNAFAVFGLLFGLSLPVTLVGKIQLGLRLGHITNKWLALASIVNLAGGAIAAIQFDSVPLVIVGMMTGTLLCGAANAARFFLSGNRNSRLTRADTSLDVVKEVLRDSLFHFLLQVIFTVTYASDTLIVARILGAEQASVFALSERIFSIVAVAVAVVSGPLWAAYGDAIGAGDERWAKVTLRTSTIKIGFASFLISLTILCFFKPAIWLLTGGDLHVPFSLALSMGCWRVVEALGASLSVYLFAHQAMKLTLALGIATAISSFAAKLLLLPYFGVTVMPIATAVCFAACSLAPLAYYVRRLGRTHGTHS
jgi:O-antigen/teichoic acid export membrane protein